MRRFWKEFRNMEKLNLPKAKLPVDFKRKTLSMDEYLEFVNFNFKYTIDKKTSRDWKKVLLRVCLFV